MAKTSVSLLDSKDDAPKRRGKACITCKIRRVRCDLSRPSCQRCLSTGRKCDGYPTVEPKKLDHDAPVALLIVMERPVPSHCDYAALTAFQFFIQVCAPGLLNYGSQQFWNELVLQACFVDESIKHLTIAASRLGSHRMLKICEESADWDPVYLSHYGKALKLLSQSQNPDPAFLLMAFLLLILCDEYQKNSFAALQHLIAGRKILATYQPGRQLRGQSDAIEELGPIFARLELQTGELYSQIRPLSDKWKVDKGRKTWLLGDIQHYAPADNTEGRWTTVDEAVHSLQAITFECTSQEVDGAPPPTRFHTVPNLTTRLNTWLDQYTLLETTIHPKPTVTNPTDLYVLRTYHLCINVLSRCEPFKQETAFDAYSSNLEHLMVSCGFLIRTARLRMIPMLFMVATRYRDASIRRRAICMLKTCGLDGVMLAKIAQRVVRIEEKNVREPIVCSDVPESSRVRLVDLVFDARAAAYVLRFRRMPYGDETALGRTSIPAPAVPWSPAPEKPVHAVSE